MPDFSKQRAKTSKLVKKVGGHAVDLQANSSQHIAKYVTKRTGRIAGTRRFMAAWLSLVVLLSLATLGTLVQLQRSVRVPAPAVFLVDLEVAHALVVAAVEVVGGGDTGLHRRLSEGVQHLPAQALAVHAPFAAVAVPARSFERNRALAPVGHARDAIQSIVILVRHEVGQAALPAPFVLARHGRPLVIVARLAAQVQHAVDAAAAAQHLAARVAQRAPVQAVGRLGLVEPVGARVADAVQVAHGDVHPVVVVLAAGLDQQHAPALVGRQAVGQQAAGGAGTDDDVVEREVAQTCLQQAGERGGRFCRR